METESERQSGSVPHSIAQASTRDRASCVSEYFLVIIRRKEKVMLPVHWRRSCCLFTVWDQCKVSPPQVACVSLVCISGVQYDGMCESGVYLWCAVPWDA